MPFKLTKLTFETMLREVPQDSLPLTFQHAIEVTRRLGKRYLWIDCLCIFQDNDDKSDWLSEAASMDKVYSNTFLNISATGAEDSSQGLFTYRDGKLEVLPTIFSYPATSGRFPASRDLVLVDAALIDREVDNTTLNGRGWVFQERWLSPRILHFGTGQLFWECRQKFLCERFPDNLPGVFYRAHDFKRFDTRSFYSWRDQRFKKSEAAWIDICGLETRDRMWQDIMRRYSNTCLTFADDRVFALSGIVKVWQNTFRDQYVAGFWRRGLDHQLAWSKCRTELRKLGRSRTYLAPTWSWLSVDGPVTPSVLHPTDQIYAEVLEVSLRHRSENTAGSITDEVLVLKGRLRPLSLSFKDHSYHVVVMEGHCQDWKLYPDEAMRDGLYVHDQSRVPVLHNYGIVMGTTRRPTHPISTDLFDFPILGISHEMLLLHCVDNDNGIFERFGLATLAEENDTFWQALQVNYANNADFPCVEYDPIKQLHTVIIK